MIKTRAIVHSSYTLPVYMQIDEDKIDQISKSKRNENYQLILPIIENKNFLIEYTSLQRSKVLSRYASSAGVNLQHLRIILARYWRYGQNIYGLLPAYSHSGAPGKERNPDRTQLGKRKKIGSYRCSEPARLYLKALIKKYHEVTRKVLSQS